MNLKREELKKILIETDLIDYLKDETIAAINKDADTWQSYALNKEEQELLKIKKSVDDRLAEITAIKPK